MTASTQDLPVPVARTMNSRARDLLTEREMECAKLWVQGLTSKEIAQQLYISEHTVRSHLAKVYDKLNVRTRMKLRDTLEANGVLADERPPCVRHGIEEIARFLAVQTVARRVETWEDAEAVIARDWPDRRFATVRLRYTRDARRLMTWLGVEPSASLPARV